MNRESALRIGIGLVIAVGGGATQAAAQAAGYPRVAATGQYLMDREAEIQLARSAAPDSLSRDATILVLGREGYERAVEGTNGFVCMVGRGWMAPFDWPEFWNPKVRAADCMNPQAARFVVPLALLRSRMVMAGHSRADILSAVKEAFANGQLPALESGAMDYMMSPSAYLTDEGGHNVPHLMFYTAGQDPADWGAGMAGSPVMAAPYWFFTPGEASRMEGLPPIHVFLVVVPDWSDGTPARLQVD